MVIFSFCLSRSRLICATFSSLSFTSSFSSFLWFWLMASSRVLKLQSNCCFQASMSPSILSNLLVTSAASKLPAVLIFDWRLQLSLLRSWVVLFSLVFSISLEILNQCALETYWLMSESIESNFSPKARWFKDNAYILSLKEMNKILL